MKKIATVLFTLAVCRFTFAADAADTFQNYHGGNYIESSAELNVLAEKNNSEALYSLAQMNLYGFGVQKNPTKALELMTKSATLKYLPAELYLGNYYFQEKHDVPTALLWYKHAADADHSDAQIFVALAYLNGYGTKINKDTARKYFIMAAKKKIPIAQFELAQVFFENKHAVDKKMARIWLMKAAENNYPDAQYQVGVMLYTGNQYDKDERQGKEWLQKAEKNGHMNAKKFLADLITQNTVTEPQKQASSLSPEQQWQALNTLLNNVHISLKNPFVATAGNDALTKTPQLVPISKTSIVRADFSVIKPNEIPMDSVISYLSKIDYIQQKPPFYFPIYPFVFPSNTSDYQQAFTTLQRQIEFGHPKSFFLLGQMYDQGLGVEKNGQHAFDLFMKSAEFGYLKAEYMVGIYYLKGCVVQKNPQTAIAWLAKAALHGSQPAQFVLGSIYEFGWGKQHRPNAIAKNPIISQAMYSLAAQTGSAIAQYRLAQLYASGILNPDNNNEIEKSNIAMAYPLFISAAKQNIPQAKIALSYFYAKPNQPKNIQENAFAIAEKAADEGNSNAALIAAIMYDRGIGIDQSHRKAMRYYKKLADTRNAIAEFMLGTYYYLDKDNAKAIALLEKSAEQGDAYALYNLAVLSQKNIYQPPGKDYLTLLQKASQQKFNKATLLLADDYLMNAHDTESMKKAADIYHQLAEKQEATAELKLGYMYENGIYFNKNMAKAQEGYLLSAKHNNPIAQYLIGMNYQLGKGAERNVNEAITYYTRSAAQNYLPAQVALGFVYELDKHDYQQALQWYVKAADCHNPQAQYNLGLMYEYGKGVKIDTKKSHALFKEAVKNGYTPTDANAKMAAQNAGPSR